MKRNDIYIQLKDILARLKPYEAEVALNYLQAFDRKKQGSRSTKSIQVIEALLENPGISYDAIKGMVSPGLDKYSFNKFLLRLRNKIFDSLTLDLNIQRKDSYSPWFRARLECAKRSVLIMNLMGRGNEVSAHELLKDQIQTCYKFELYDLAVEALRTSLNSESLRYGKAGFDKIHEKVRKAEKARDAIYKALEWNTRFYMVTDRKASQNEQVGILMEALSELQQLYTETGAALVGQYMHTFEMEYHQTMGDYHAASISGNQLLQLIENKPALKSQYRLTSAYFNMAHNDLLRHNLSSAMHNINKCLKGTGTGSYNHMVVTTLKAQTEYFMGEFNLSLNTVGNVLESDMIKIAPFESCKMQYVKACVLFNQQTYLKAYNIFNSENILMDSDPEGWNVGVRLMCILCLVEMQLDDLADMSIESLRKHMSRTNDERHFSTRDKAILKILRSLERNSFDFAITYFKNQELFFKLQSDHSEYCWKIKSHEYIVFHDWFQAKLAGQPYEFAIPEFLPLETNDLNTSNNQNTAR